MVLVQHGYYLNGLLESPTLLFEVGRTYRFKQDDSTNGTHQIRFYNDVARTSAYSTNVSLVGSAGSAGSYSEIFITPQTANVLYYQCKSSLHGRKIIVSNTTSSHLIDTPDAHFTLINANTSNISTITSGLAATDLSIAHIADTSDSHFTGINEILQHQAATDLTIAHIADTWDAHFTLINENTTNISTITSGLAATDLGRSSYCRYLSSPFYFNKCKYNRISSNRFISRNRIRR